jgi:hypothetical protein
MDNTSVKILLRCIGRHGVGVIYFICTSVDVACVVVAVRTVVCAVFVYACYLGCVGLSKHKSLLGSRYRFGAPVWRLFC